MLAARIAHFLRASGFGFFSVTIHLALVVLCVLFATPANDSFAADKDLIDVEIQPALGQPHGKDKGKGLGSHVPKAPPPLPEPEPFVPPAPLPPPDPDAIPTTTDPEELPPDAGAAEDAGDAAVPVEAGSPDGGEFDPTTPVGTENVAPAFGSPDGVDGGQGTGPPKPRMTPQYAAILSAWFHARVSARSLGAPPDGEKPSVTVSISISPDLRVTGFSLNGSSGHPAFDDQIRNQMATIQASGATLPAPPEGGPPVPSFTTRFNWQ